MNKPIDDQKKPELNLESLRDFFKLMRARNNKPIVTSGATFRFYHRPEGWSAACEVMEQSVNVSFYKTECEAIAALNVALGQAGLMRYRFNGGEV